MTIEGKKIHRAADGGRLPAILAATLLAATPLIAQAPAPAGSRAAALPAARKIIDRHITAIGGRSAILARTSSHATGTVAIPSAGMNGTLELFAAKPDKAILRISLSGVGAIEEGFDGRTGWSSSAVTGPTVLQGKELEQKRFDSDFYADLHADGRYDSMTTVEKTTFEGRPCYKIRLVKRGGGEDFEFYDVETGLKAGAVTTRETPMGAFTGTTIESDYKRFGPLLQPTTIKQTVMGLQQVITIAAIEYDSVNPTVFEPPPAIKALMK